MYNLVVILLLLSGAVVTMLTIIAFRRRDIPLAYSMAVSLLCAAVWNFGFAAEIISPSLEDKLYWANIQFLGIAFIPVAWLFMTLIAAGQDKRAKALVPALVVIPILTNIIIWTDPIHHLFRLMPQLITSGVPFPILDNDYGTYFFYVHAGYSYFLFAASLFVLVRNLGKTTGVYRKQFLILILSVILPLTVDLLYVFGISPIKEFNFTSISFTLSGLLLAVNILRNKFLDLLPLVYDVVVQEMNVGVVVLDEQSRISYLNPASEKILEVKGKDAIGQDCAETFPKLAKFWDDSCEDSIEIILSHGDYEGTYQLQCVNIHSRTNAVVGRVLTLHDVTERVALYEKIEQLSITDPLTEALNRRALSTFTEQEITRAYRYRRNLSMILLDVDNFKEINDHFGHQRGDEILKDIVLAVRRTVRASDLIFRYGGDEFVLLLVETDVVEARKTAERIRAQLTEFVLADSLGVEFKVAVSMGVTSLASGDTPSSMLHRADQALYRAKDAGKDRAELV